MNEASEHSPNDEPVEETNTVRDPDLVDDLDALGETRSVSGWRLQLGIFCLMLVLALVGLGMTQSLESGAWEYWSFVVFVYAALGVWKRSRRAKQTGQPAHKQIINELLHWGTLLGFLAVLLFLERRQVIDRQSASHFALMLLALSCFMAGVHIDWQLLLVGAVLTIMVVSVALLEQYAIMLWLIMIVVVCVAVAFFYVKTKRRSPK